MINIEKNYPRLWLRIAIFIIASYICFHLEFYAVLYLFKPAPKIFSKNGYIVFLLGDIPKILPYILFALFFSHIYKHPILMSALLPISSFFMEMGICFKFDFSEYFFVGGPLFYAFITIIGLKIGISILASYFSTWIIKIIKKKKSLAEQNQ